MINEHDIKDMKEESTRGKVLNEANSIVNGARANVYGGPEDSFRTIASLWSTYLSRAGSVTSLTAPDVASMMALLKIARLQNSPDHWDSWVDLAGYAACGAETASKK
jgi:hypothetical protein